MARALPAVVAGVGVLGAVAPASGQSQLGVFRQWLGGALGGVGTDPSAPGGFTILVDDDGDFLTPPVPYNLGAQAPELAGATNYALSPTRRTLYVLDGALPGSGSPRVWFADLDGMGGVDVRHGPFVVSGAFGDARVLGGPFYYESFGGLRTAALVLGVPDGSELWVQLFDLNTPGLSGQARVDLSAGWERGWFSPAGGYLVVKNGLSDNDTQFVDYTLINSCGVSGDFGSSSLIKVSGSLVPPDPVFEVVGVGTGTIDVVGQIAGQMSPVFAGTLPLCGAAVGPELGACCITLGTGQTICVDGITQVECGTGAFSPGMNCEDVCPQPMVEVAGGAPATVLAGEPLTYSFTVDNTGGGDAFNVSVFATAPSGTTIESVSSGGSVSGGTNANWTIPTLAGGASQTVTMTVTAPCAPGTLLLESAAYGAQLGFSFFSGPDLTTDVLAPSAGDITISVDSVPQGSDPAIQGDLALHTITLTNGGPIAADGVTLGCFNMGNGNSLGTVIDDAGGQVVTGQCGPESLAWEGTLQPGETRTLVFTTRLDCVSQTNPGGPLGVLLNRGVTLQVRGGEPCNAVLASAAATRIDAVPPISASLSFAEIGANTLRFNPVDIDFAVPEVVGLGRLGEPAEVILTIRNEAGPDLTDASFVYSLGESWEAVGNPFIGTPPAGVTFDSASEEVRYQGPLAAGETVEVRMSLVMSSPDRPDDRVALSSSPGCAIPGFAERDAQIFAVPATPAEPHVHGLSSFDHYRHDPPLGFPSVRLPDFYFELLAGIAAGPDNSIYVADLLFNYVINPDTLFFDVFEGNAFPIDADPVSGGVLHGAGSDLYRYFPDGTRELVYTDPAGQFTVAGATVTDDGMIHLQARDPATSVVTIVSLDPAGATLPLGPGDAMGSIPVPVVSYPYESGWGPLISRNIVGFSDDGTDLLVLVQSFFSGPNPGDGGSGFIAFVRIDPATGSATIVEPELGFVQGFNGPPLPAGAQPIFLSQVTGIAGVSRDAGPIFELQSGTGFAGYDPATRVPEVFIVRNTQDRYQGIAIVEPGCGPADFDDNGTLDLMDVSAFTAAFNAGELRADFNADGVFDLDDISAYIAAFLAGCP